MDLTLHVIGDVRFLYTVLNGIAMLFATQDLRTACAIGALVGVLLMCFRALLEAQGKGPRVSEFLGAILLWLLLFEPRTSVTLEDVYRGESRVVSNVPLGPAVAGSVISELGYGLTRLFETAFQTPSMTRTGYAGSLETLAHLRRQFVAALQLGSFEQGPAGIDPPRSVESYIQDCTLTGVDLGQTSLGDLLGRSALPEALRFDSQIYTTRIWDGTAAGTLTCTEAWPRLMTLIEGPLQEHLHQTITRLFEQDPMNDPESRIQSALDALTQGELAAGDYMLAAVLVPLFEQGVLNRHREARDTPRVSMVEAAIHQRNSQWAAEHTLFGRIVRPMLTWIEGFSYAITPIMAFTLLLGNRGIRMCGQYGMMLIWIQFWMPLLAIGNLYITLAAEGSLSHLLSQNFDPRSITGIYRMDQELQNWVAVGGMLASATPAIALMLVYGGSVTATHFLGRLQGGDFLDEKTASPALTGSSPLIAIDPRHRHSTLSGLGAEGADRLLPNFEMAQDLHHLESQSAQRSEQAQQTFLDGIRRSSSARHSLSSDVSKGLATSEHFTGGTSATDRLIESQGESLSRKYHDSGLSGHDFATLVGGSLRGGFEGSPSGSPSTRSSLNAQLSSVLQDHYHVGSQRADEIASDLLQTVGQDHTFQNALARTLSKDAEEGTRSIGSLGLSSESLAELSKSAAAVIESSEAHRLESAQTLKFGAQTQVSARDAGLLLSKDPQKLEALDHALDAVGLRGDTERLARNWQHQGLILDFDQARAAAGISLLTGQSDPVYHAMGHDEAVLASTLGRSLLGDALKANTFQQDLDPTQPLDKEAGDRADFRDRIATNLAGTEAADAQKLSEDLSRFQGEIRAKVEHADLEVKRMADPQQAAGAAFLESSESHFEKALKSAMDQSLLEAGKEESPSAWVHDTLQSFFLETGTELAIIGESIGESVSRSVRESLNRGETPINLLETFKNTWPQVLQEGIDRYVEGRMKLYEADLTPPQQAYLRASLIEAFQIIEDGKSPTSPSMRRVEAQRALDEEAQERSPEISAILKKMGSSHRKDLSGLLRSYNGHKGFIQR